MLGYSFYAMHPIQNPRPVSSFNLQFGIFNPRSFCHYSVRSLPSVRVAVHSPEKPDGHAGTEKAMLYVPLPLPSFNSPLTSRVNAEFRYPEGREEFVAVPAAVKEREGPERTTAPPVKGHFVEFRYVHSPAMVTVPSDFLVKVQTPLPPPRSTIDCQVSVVMVELLSLPPPLACPCPITNRLKASVTAITRYNNGYRLMIYSPFDALQFSPPDVLFPCRVPSALSENAFEKGISRVKETAGPSTSTFSTMRAQ